MSIQDLYVANTRQCPGYPLHRPTPRRDLKTKYIEDGFQIGDVGFVSPEGEFIPLHNICVPPQEGLRGPIYQPVDPCQIQRCDGYPSGHRFISSGVVRMDMSSEDSNLAYKFTAESKAGAVLILPSGATLFQLDDSDMKRFREAATTYARQWCGVHNKDSLYLITGAYKTRDFTLASFDAHHPGGVLRVVAQQGNKDASEAYFWDCDFQGFRITVRWGWLALIEELGLYKYPVFPYIASLFSALLVLLKDVFEMAEGWLSRTAPFKLLEHLFQIARSLLPQTTVELISRSSQPLHPSDIINRYLLKKDPLALIAITHDNEWIDMLERGGLPPEDLLQEDHFLEFLEKNYTADTDDGECCLSTKANVGFFFRTVDVCGLSATYGGHTGSFDAEPSPDFSQLESATENAQAVITHIRVEGITANLGHVPTGFYVRVDIPNHASKRTKNRSIMVNDQIIQWNDLIYLPSDPSIMVTLIVFTTCELGQMIGRVKKSVDELRNCSHPFTLVDKEGEDVRPRVSLHAAAQELPYHHRTRGRLNEVDPVALDCEESLMEATDKGHDDILRYYKTPSEDRLRSAIFNFEHALVDFPGGHLYHAAALFNLATAEFIRYQYCSTMHDFENKCLSRYRQVLKLRRDDHPDRPLTLLRLAQAILYRSDAEGATSTDGGLSTEFIDELKSVCLPGTHARRAVDLVLQTYERILLGHSEDLGKLDDLISTLEVAAQEPPVAYFDKPDRWNNLGLALQRRFQLQRKANDLDRAIKSFETAVRIAPDNHLDRPTYMNNLGNALILRG